MSEDARLLFDALRAKVLQIDTNIIELAEQKSVSYHGPAFFLEVLPRKNRITLLLDLDFNEVDDPFRLVDWVRQYEAGTGFSKMLVLFGVGDHGGGPSQESARSSSRCNESGQDAPSARCG